jgi:ribokinase
MSILVVGGANYDLIAVGGRLPQEGETLVADSFSGSPGGKSANQAAAAARWGAVTRLVSCIGDDDYGREIAEELTEAGVNIELVTRHRSGTGLGMVFIDKQGRYITMVAPRANGQLSESIVQTVTDLIWKKVSVLCLALEAPSDALEEAARRAHDFGARIVLNTAPADRLTPKLLEAADVLVCNEHEASELVGHEVTDQESAFRAAHALSREQRSVVVTLGSAGAVAWSPDEGRCSVLGIKVRAVDTLGAGDIFVGVLAAELTVSASLCNAIQAANRAAAASVTHTGARFAKGTPAGVSTILDSNELSKNQEKLS